VSDRFEADVQRMQRALAAERDRRAQRLGRRDERQERRAARRAGRRRKPRSGVGLLIGAAVLTGVVVDGAPFWLLFIAVWMLFEGARRLIGSRPPEVEGEAVQDETGVDARLARVDQLCDQLLADIQNAPPVLRTIVQRPEEAVQSLREGVHALERREREIRALARPEDDARLQSERESLQRRLSAEQDAVTRQRLGQALEALDQQRSQRASLLTAASRLEAERTRLLYTLEGLHTQVLAVRSTAEAGQEQAAADRLRQSLDTLSSEVSAVAGALESVQAVDAGPVPTPEPRVSDARVPERR
jgi:DNA repair exonuclease SbcCD ATPase subunit